MLRLICTFLTESLVLGLECCSLIYRRALFLKKQVQVEVITENYLDNNHMSHLYVHCAMYHILISLCFTRSWCLFHAETETERERERKGGHLPLDKSVKGAC